MNVEFFLSFRTKEQPKRHLLCGNHGKNLEARALVQQDQGFFTWVINDVLVVLKAKYKKSWVSGITTLKKSSRL